MFNKMAFSCESNRRNTQVEQLVVYKTFNRQKNNNVKCFTQEHLQWPWQHKCFINTINCIKLYWPVVSKRQCGCLLLDPRGNHLSFWCNLVYVRSLWKWLLLTLLPCLLNGFPQQRGEGGQSDKVPVLPVSLHPWKIMPQLDTLWGWDGLSKIYHPYVCFAAAVVDEK